MNTNLEKVKIVVVGDSGVGKTSLVHLICHQEVLKKTSWTIGCSVDVKVHEYKDGTVQQKTYFLEFWDVSGSVSSCKKHFFGGVDGIILTHDLTNRKSQENLKKWLNEVIDESTCTVSVGTSSSSNDYLNQNVTYSINMPPAIVIGTKFDEAQNVRDLSSLRSLSSIALEYKLDEINLDSLEPKYLSPGSNNSVKLAKFFDKVIECKLRQSLNSLKKTSKSTLDNRTHSIYHME